MVTMLACIYLRAYVPECYLLLYVSPGPFALDNPKTGPNHLRPILNAKKCKNKPNKKKMTKLRKNHPFGPGHHPNPYAAQTFVARLSFSSECPHRHCRDRRARFFRITEVLMFRYINCNQPLSRPSYMRIIVVEIRVQARQPTNALNSSKNLKQEPPSAWLGNSTHHQKVDLKWWDLCMQLLK
jgi:hypothetical protein